jgi:hypothetical protein
MSIFQVQYLCRELLRDHDFRKAMQANPEQALAGKDLTKAELTAMATGDVGKLYKMGAHPFILGYLWRFGIAGLTVAQFSERIRKAGPKLSASEKKKAEKRAAERYSYQRWPDRVR